MGAKESKVNQPRHILRGGQKISDDDESSSYPVSYKDVSKRSACEIYGLKFSDEPQFDSSQWISGLIDHRSVFRNNIHPSQRAPTALRVLAYGGTTSTNKNSQRCVLITASTAIRTPTVPMYVGNGWNGTIFSIFSTGSAGHYSPDDIKAFTHIYGLDDQILSSQCKNGNLEREDFDSLICKEHVDLVSVRYPFQLLKLISYHFEHINGVDAKWQHTVFSPFMSAIFERTFGKAAPSWKWGLFGHIGIVEYLKGDSKIEELPVKNFQTLIQLWGLKETRARQMVSVVVKQFGNTGSIPYKDLYKKFQVDTLNHKSDVPRLRDPSDLFHLIDTDNNGFISEDEIHYFADRFNQDLSTEGVTEIIVIFDLDGDGLLGFEDFRQVMQPILAGTSWEVWLVGVAFAIFLAANRSILV